RPPPRRAREGPRRPQSARTATRPVALARSSPLAAPRSSGRPSRTRRTTGPCRLRTVSPLASAARRHAGIGGRIRSSSFLSHAARGPRVADGKAVPVLVEPFPLAAAVGARRHLGGVGFLDTTAQRLG